MARVEDVNLGVIDLLVTAYKSMDRKMFDSCYADPLVIHDPDGDITMSHDEHWQSVVDTFAVSQITGPRFLV